MFLIDKKKNVTENPRLRFPTLPSVLVTFLLIPSLMEIYHLSFFFFLFFCCFACEQDYLKTYNLCTLYFCHDCQTTIV